jgi:predicted Zn finger-like uncharacterized protein
MRTVTCPECKSALPLQDADAAGRSTVRCPSCGVSVPVQGADAVAFPRKHKDETMLDLSEAVKAVRKRRRRG